MRAVLAQDPCERRSADRKLCRLPKMVQRQVEPTTITIARAAPRMLGAMRLDHIEAIRLRTT
jgi:hypothetical protein